MSRVTASDLPMVETSPAGLRDAATQLRALALTAPLDIDEVTTPWRALSESYTAPESAQVLEAMTVVEAPTTDLALALEHIAGALDTYADAVDLVLVDLAVLGNDVESFDSDVSRAQREDESAWYDDDGLVSTNDDLTRRVGRVTDAFDDATRTFVLSLDQVDVDVSGLPFARGEWRVAPGEVAPADTFARWHSAFDEYDDALFARLQSLASLSAAELAAFAADDPLLLEALVNAQPDPAAVSAWWTSMLTATGGLSVAQRRLIRGVPGAVGNLEGVPYDVRDRANRAMLDGEIAEIDDRMTALDERIAALRADPGADRAEAMASGRELADLLAERDALADRRDPLEAIRRELGRARPEGAEIDSGDRSLVNLDLTGGAPLVAVATGDLQNADYVSYLVSGMGSDASSMPGTLGDAGRLSALVQRNEPGSTVATVAWLDYSAPLMPQKAPTQVLGDDHAIIGGDRLAETLNGLGAVQAAAGNTDAYVSAMAHSYGTTTLVEALKQEVPTVDVAALYGSAGVDVGSLDEVHVPSGGIYATEARGWDGDLVADNGRTLSGRRDPLDLEGVHEFSSEDARLPDGSAGEDASGHSDYLRARMTSLFNLGLIASDRAEAVVR